MLIQGSPDKNFWEFNGELRFLTPFKKLIDEYGDKESSLIMWSIYMIEDPRSRFYRMAKEQRTVEVTNNYYPAFDPQKYPDAVTSYGYLTLSKEENLFKIQMDKIDELTSYLKQLSFDNEVDFKKSMQIMGKLGKMWTDVELVKSRMIESFNKSNIKGGAKESIRESRNK